MSGETEKDVSAWTIDSLHEHLTALVAERDRRYEQRFDAQEKAVSKAEVAAEKRFDSVNEFRAQLGDQARTLMPRAEADVRFSAIEEKINDLRGTRREGIQASTGAMFAVAGLAVAIIVAAVAVANVLTG